MNAEDPARPRKIIHVDMDCFYAAIEIRDRPELAGKPVAVGGRSSRRGVLTTCNYEARRFGCHSAMPTFQALERCPRLVILPVRFDVYREESQRIRAIMARFTDLIEPLSLDEAYLDVSHWRSSGSAVAEEIRAEIREATGLTASAGIAPNKLLAKIASDWNKPNGQFEIHPEDIDRFVRGLPVKKLWGVGKKTAAKLGRLGWETCADLQKVSLTELHRHFGKFGSELYHLCRGQDDRPVRVSRERKSLSNEHTYFENLASVEACLTKLQELHAELEGDLCRRGTGDGAIKSVFVKLKFDDFKHTTVERQADRPDWEHYEHLLREGWGRREGRTVRLLGAGVRFRPAKPSGGQLELFEEA